MERIGYFMLGLLLILPARRMWRWVCDAQTLGEFIGYLSLFILVIGSGIATILHVL